MNPATSFHQYTTWSDLQEVPYPEGKPAVSPGKGGHVKIEDKPVAAQAYLLNHRLTSSVKA